jgi:hypothetical protein
MQRNSTIIAALVAVALAGAVNGQTTGASTPG